MTNFKSANCESNPYSTFIIIHLEVGGDTKSLEYQKTFWPTLIDLFLLAKRCNIKLTLQFNPQWAEYILEDKYKFNLLKEWQENGHEVGLHHHGYDHPTWNGYTNRRGIENSPQYRGTVKDMMKLMRELANPYEILCGTITDEEFDYPEGVKYDTEGIQVYHGRGKLKRVFLGGRELIQAGMGFLSFNGDIEDFKEEYNRTEEEEVFGIVTHESDFAKNPEIIKDWFRFIKSRGGNIETVSEIINSYLERYPVEYSDSPLTFLKNVAIS